jgi:hypothetical protein
MMNRLTARDDQVGSSSIRIRIVTISTEHFRAILMFSQAERPLFSVPKYGSNGPAAAEVSYFHAADYFPVPTSRPHPSRIDFRIVFCNRIPVQRKSTSRDQKFILSHALAPLAVMNRLALSPARHASAPAITSILPTRFGLGGGSGREWN